MMMESPGNLFLGFGHSLVGIGATQGKVEACFFHSFVIRHSSFALDLCHLTEAKFCVALDKAT